MIAMHSRLSILGDAKEKCEHSEGRKSECGQDRGNFDRPATAQIVTLGRKAAAQTSGVDIGETRREQGREGTRKKIDARAALRYCPESRFDAVVGQTMNLDPITPSGRIIEE